MEFKDLEQDGQRKYQTLILDKLFNNLDEKLMVNHLLKFSLGIKILMGKLLKLVMELLFVVLCLKMVQDNQLFMLQNFLLVNGTFHLNKH